MYGKLFSSMYEGTLYGQWEAIVTLQQMVILADEDGVLDVTPPALAAKTSIPLEIIEKGLALLSEPDKYSRSSAEDGRRIVLIDADRPWGWQIVNYRHYRNLASREDKKRKDRERIREKRAVAAGYDGPITGEDCSYCGAPATGVDHIIPTSRGGKDTDENTTPACHRCNSSKRDRDLIDFLNDSTTEIDVDRVLENQKLTRFVAFCRASSRFVADVAHTNTYTNTKKRHTSTAARFDEFWLAYPKKVEKKKALGIWKRRKLDSIADTLIADIKRRTESDRKWIEGYIPNPTTYLNGDRWEDEMESAAQSLPNDQSRLWEIRKACGLSPFYDDLKACHAEINAKLRANPELRAAL